MESVAGRDYQRDEETLGSDPDVYYLDRSTEVTSSKCINLYTLNMCSLWYVKDISIKMFKKNS